MHINTKDFRAKQEQAKPVLEEFNSQTYIPELDLSKLSLKPQIECELRMDKSWFFNQLVIGEKPEVVPEQGDLPF